MKVGYLTPSMRGGPSSAAAAAAGGSSAAMGSGGCPVWAVVMALPSLAICAQDKGVSEELMAKLASRSITCIHQVLSSNSVCRCMTSRRHGLRCPYCLGLHHGILACFMACRASKASRHTHSSSWHAWAIHGRPGWATAGLLLHTCSSRSLGAHTRQRLPGLARALRAEPSQGASGVHKHTSRCCECAPAPAWAPPSGSPAQHARPENVGASSCCGLNGSDCPGRHAPLAMQVVMQACLLKESIVCSLHQGRSSVLMRGPIRTPIQESRMPAGRGINWRASGGQR